MSPIKALGCFLLIATVLALWVGHREIKTLQEQNEALTRALSHANNALNRQLEFMGRIENATTRLEEKENARQQQFNRFERRLKSLSEQDEQLRNVLSTIIPDQLLHGLQAFPDSQPIQDTE